MTAGLGGCHVESRSQVSSESALDGAAFGRRVSGVEYTGTGGFVRQWSG